MEVLKILRTLLPRLVRCRGFVAGLLAACLVLGFAFTSIASVSQQSLRETRHFEGQVGPFAEGRNTSEVLGASYDHAGFGEARAEGLECGVGVVFLSESAWAEFQATGRLPSAQLTCARTFAVLPGAVAAALVENQRQRASNWSFDLDLFDVSRPYAIYGLPAIAFLLAAAVGSPILILRWALASWIEAPPSREKE